MTGHLVRLTCGLLVAIVVSACASAPSTQETPGTASPQASSDAETLPPPGYGTLRQDAFTVALASGPVQVKVTPLAESVIRLAAPDTYQRLHGLVQSRQAQIREMARNAGLREDPGVYMVSFFTREIQASYEPTDLQLLSNGILYRPVGIIPLSGEWGRQQVKQQVSQSALYLYDPMVNLDVTFQVEYAGVVALDWAGIVHILQAERGRVVSRAGG
jgi:hypothetical protein